MFRSYFPYKSCSEPAEETEEATEAQWGCATGPWVSPAEWSESYRLSFSGLWLLSTKQTKLICSPGVKKKKKKATPSYCSTRAHCSACLSTVLDWVCLCILTLLTLPPHSSPYMKLWRSKTMHLEETQLQWTTLVFWHLLLFYESFPEWWIWALVSYCKRGSTASLNKG